LPTCPRCEKELPAESRFCLHCGKRIQRRSDSFGAVSDRLQRALGEDYKVEGEVGRGGFAFVFSVRDLRLERRLAVKVIRPEFLTTDVVVARFQREAKIVAQLNHENCLEISFAGEGEGLVYCAMRYIEGDTLRERMKRDGRQPVDFTLRLFGEIAQGLAHAHEKGILHRDVTPSNIMLDREAQDRAVLLDFGIAKGLWPVGGKLSISGQVVGSPQYMSPERLAGAKNIDMRSDIYSLGIVAYEMLTGHVPKGDAPHARDPRKWRRDVPEALARSIERCIQLSPDARWPSVREAAAALGR
jgi:eukaryotic-like serine/threonine-protein kinase